MGRIQLSENQKWVIVAVLVGLLVSGGMLWGYVRGLEAGHAAREGTVGAAAVGPINLAAGVDCRSGSTACVVARNGRDLVMYSDSGSTEKFSVDGATGNVAVSTSKFTVAGASGNAVIAGTLNMSNQPISNIGAAGTDFSATGGLTLADGLTVSAGGANVTGNITGTLGTAAQPNITSLGSLTGLTVASGSVSLPDNAITAAMIANPSRSINLPLPSFVDTANGANIAWGSTTGPNFSAAINAAISIAIVVGDGNLDVGTTFMVPPDYLSGGGFRFRARKATDSGPASEDIQCWVEFNGGSSSSITQVAVVGTASAAYLCSPNVTYTASGAVTMNFQLSSGGDPDDDVYIDGVEFFYTASQ